MTDDRTRNAILARRARFVAAALTATLGGTACQREREGIGPDPAKAGHDAAGKATDAGAAPAKDAAEDESVPMPCLSAPPMDAGPPSPPDAGKPVPCLKMVPPMGE